LSPPPLLLLMRLLWPPAAAAAAAAAAQLWQWQQQWLQEQVSGKRFVWRSQAFELHWTS